MQWYRHTQLFGVAGFNVDVWTSCAFLATLGDHCRVGWNVHACGMDKGCAISSYYSIVYVHVFLLIFVFL